MALRRRVCTGARYRGKTEAGTYGFVAATQQPVDVGNGREILIVSGCCLKRYLSNPVVLDNHDLSKPAADAAIGRAASIYVSGGELLADIEFDVADKQGARVAGKVERGFLRALSVGWNPKVPADGSPPITFVSSGERRSFGALEVIGPASVVTSWELIEISVVPVPADQFSLSRGFDIGATEMKKSEKPGEEEEKEGEGEEGEGTPPTDMASSRAEAQEAAHQREEDEEESKRMEEEEETRACDEESKRMEGEEEEEEEMEVEKKASRAASVSYQRAQVVAEIRAIAPRGMENLADELVLEDVSADDARKRFKTELQKRNANVGSVEPKIRSASALDALDDNTFVAAFGGC